MRASWTVRAALLVSVGLAPIGARAAPPDPPASRPQPGADAAAETANAGDPAAKAAREQELEAVHAQQKEAAEAEAKLRAEIDAIADDRRKLSEALIDTASKVRSVETRLGATEARLASLRDNERAMRRSLDARRDVIVEILAALQRIGRRAPPALMVSPEDALSAVRTAMLLGAVLPEMRAKAEALAAELAQLVAVRKNIAAEHDELNANLAALSQARQHMTLLVEARQRRQAEAEQALADQRQRAIALARQADNLKDLIAKLEQSVAAQAAAKAQEASKEASGDAARERAKGEGGESRLATLSDPGRLAPAIAFASAKGALPLPVNGVKIREFGAPDGLGGIEKGLWIASRAAAQVTAPCDGWVVYAGPFRSYGQLLILNAGGGYHILLAGMERISVDLGQFVLTGEPVAMMGNGPQSAAAVATGSSQPVLYVEFRKDGTPVDPGPWWATTDSERVRG